jgi:RNA-binding protein YhbY
MSIAQIQLGKNGITENFVETLKNHFKKHETVKVSVLKSCTRNREEIKKIEKKILDGLGKNYTSKKIGYTLSLKKWRKPVR